MESVYLVRRATVDDSWLRSGQAFLDLPEREGGNAKVRVLRTRLSQSAQGHGTPPL